MTAYYLIKPVGDCLILGNTGPEIRAYAGAAGALLFLLVILCKENSRFGWIVFD